MEKKDFIIWASRLQEKYKPSDDVLNKISKVDLLAVVGPTGVGKTTIIDSLNIPKVRSDVTRDKRPDEKNNKDYNFRDDYINIINEIKKGNYVQFLISNSGEFYGTHISEYPSSGVCAMAIYAKAIPHFKEIGFNSVKQIYIMPPSYVEWMHRIGGVRTKDLLTRISEAKDSILLAQADKNYTYILNDTIELAVLDIKKIIADEDIDEHRQQLAYSTGDILLERIGANND